MDDNRALSMLPKLWIVNLLALVGEHSSLHRRCVVRHAGASGKANVGISNDNEGGKPSHRKTKVS